MSDKKVDWPVAHKYYMYFNFYPININHRENNQLVSRKLY